MSWWNPVDWAKDALHDATDVEKVVAKWVIAEGVKLGNLVAQYSLDMVEDIRDWELFAGIEIERLRQRIDAVVDAAESVGAAALEAAESELRSWVWDVVHEVEAGWDWTYHHVITPAIDDLYGDIERVEADGIEAWHVFLADVWRPAMADMHEAERLAERAESWIEHAGLDAVRLVEHAADWLELFAEYPIKSFEGLPDEVRELVTLPWAKSQGEVVPGLWRELEAIAEGWI